MAHVGTSKWIGALLLLSLVGCESEEKCVWGVDALLAKVNAGASDRTDCGSFNAISLEQIANALECVKTAPAQRGAQVTVNYCVDCSIPSTFVRTAEGELFRVEMEDDAFGDDTREAKVQSCAELVFSESDGIHCVDAKVLYACSDDR